MICRREFLKKVSLGSGAISFSSGFPAFSNSIFGSSQSLIVHASDRVFSSNLSNRLVSQNLFAEKIILGTFSTDILLDRENSKVNSNGIDGLLYSKEWRNHLINSEPGLSLRNLPFVNSHLDLSEEEGFVRKHIILKKSNLKIGLMGFIAESFESDTVKLIEELNKKANDLKVDFGCDKVYCLTDSFGQNSIDHSIYELVGATENIDYFFSTSTKSSRLCIAPNKNNEEVLISLSNLKEKEQGIMTLERKNFKDFTLA
ncbi:hypothetical protein JYB64_07785 [Algoriphagus aestuarii]|nr:hypothetical protein [Algoriphagus aestuarii]